MKRNCFLFSLILFSSCFSLAQHQPSKEEMEKVFIDAAFDKKVIADFTKYNALAQLALDNLDTIINYKNAINYITVIGENGKQTKQLQKDNCFMFLNGNDYYGIQKTPSFLSSKLDSLWTLIDKPMFSICKQQSPASLVIKVEFRKREKRILECHFLYWGLKPSDNKDSFDFVKDSILSKDCTYRIGVTTDNSGW